MTLHPPPTTPVCEKKTMSKKRAAITVLETDHRRRRITTCTYHVDVHDYHATSLQLKARVQFRRTRPHSDERATCWVACIPGKSHTSG